MAKVNGANGFFARIKEWIGRLNLRRNVGIDLGTVNVLVYVEGKGVVLKEPSVVAIDKTTDQIVAVGNEAQALIGRTPANIETIRPLSVSTTLRFVCCSIVSAMPAVICFCPLAS